MERIPIYMDPIWGWSFILVGITQKRCYVEFGHDALHLRFGPGRVSIPYDNIRDTEQIEWGWGEYGVRHGPESSVGFIGSHERVVLLRLRSQVKVRCWPFDLQDNHVAVSVPDPGAFMRQLRERVGLAEDKLDERAEQARDQRRQRKQRAEQSRSDTDTEPPSYAGAELGDTVFSAAVYPRMSVGFTWLAAKLILVALLIAIILVATQPVLAIPVITAMAAVLALLFGGRARLAQTRVTVGSDGVLLERNRDKRFLAFSQIADAVEVDEVVLRLILHDGEFVDVDTGKGGSLRIGYRNRCDKLLNLIRAGIDRVEEQQPESANREAGALRDRAHVLLRGAEGSKRVAYRTMPALSTDQLWEVFDNTAASAAERGAAAVLLRQQQGDEAKPRLRIASEQTVNPELRRLLRVAVDESDEQLREALAELESSVDPEERTPPAWVSE